MFVTLVTCLVVNARRFLARRREVRDVGQPLRFHFTLGGLLTAILFVAVGFGGRSPKYAFWLGMVALLVLVWFTIRPPRTMLTRRLWWGISLAFVSSVVAAAIS